MPRRRARGCNKSRTRALNPSFGKSEWIPTFNSDFFPNFDKYISILIFQKNITFPKLFIQSLTERGEGGVRGIWHLGFANTNPFCPSAVFFIARCVDCVASSRHPVTSTWTLLGLLHLQLHNTGMKSDIYFKQVFKKRGPKGICLLVCLLSIFLYFWIWTIASYNKWTHCLSASCQETSHKYLPHCKRGQITGVTAEQNPEIGSDLVSCSWALQEVGWWPILGLFTWRVTINHETALLPHRWSYRHV